MHRQIRSYLLALLLSFAWVNCSANADAADPWIGSWAFELPDGNPAWLKIAHSNGELTGELLWSVGSAKSVTALSLDDGTLTFKRKIRWKPYGESIIKSIDEPMSARLVDGSMTLTVKQTEQGKDKREETLVIKGKRMPPMPSPPNLKTIKFGKPITLFNGHDLEGWKLTNPNKTNGWRAENGVLINETPKSYFSAYGDYGNLRTEQVFADFRLTIEYKVAPGANSGVYLRGMYEAQVVDRDSRMQGIQGPGAIFARITPSKNAGKPGGQWNRYELTLVDRHITVILNGTNVIDNKPIYGCTGGGISADDTKPGPIFLQGDHTSVQYRNIVIQPRVENK